MLASCFDCLQRLKKMEGLNLREALFLLNYSNIDSKEHVYLFNLKKGVIAYSFLFERIRIVVYIFQTCGEL